MHHTNSASSNNQKAPEQRLLKMWRRYGKTTVGRQLFSIILGRTAPYSGSIGALVNHLEPGVAEVSLKDRKKLRNHLNSIHAIALANLGELASGLAMISAIPPETRAIVVDLKIKYIKKARGQLFASGSAAPPEIITQPLDSVALAEIKDSEGDIVATVNVLWRLSPKQTQDNNK